MFGWGSCNKDIYSEWHTIKPTLQPSAALYYANTFSFSLNWRRLSRKFLPSAPESPRWPVGKLLCNVSQPLHAILKHTDLKRNSPNFLILNLSNIQFMGTWPKRHLALLTIGMWNSLRDLRHQLEMAQIPNRSLQLDVVFATSSSSLLPFTVANNVVICGANAVSNQQFLRKAFI